MNTQRTPQITLFGNLGANPETHNLKGRTVNFERYDIATDSVVSEHTAPDRQIRTASLAVNGRDGDGNDLTRWHRLVDFKEYLAGCGKGDRLKATGYFRDRAYLKDGQEKTIRELVLTAAEIQPKRTAAPAPEPAPAPQARGRKAGTSRRTSKARPVEPVAPIEPMPFDDDDIPF